MRFGIYFVAENLVLWARVFTCNLVLAVCYFQAVRHYNKSNQVFSAIERKSA
ncbi:hypothetical protein D1AOALGA4SA_6937 [Olavius algarvensis Delta 1 endosymbiont]|nr:hypothetical protein D1AOALGA4SA_6937 [Olavius algarvensis Delta 1 endosymbiont]